MDAEAAASFPVSGTFPIENFTFNVSGNENVIDINRNLNTGVKINGSARIDSFDDIYF